MPAIAIEVQNTSGPTRPAPRLLATRGSLADLAARRPSLRSRLDFQARRVIAAIEPWYDWGRTEILSVRDEVYGEGRYFTVDWFGLHLSISVGRTPKGGQS